MQNALSSLVLLGLWTLASCSASSAGDVTPAQHATVPAVTATAALARAPDEPAALVSLRRSGCFGRCPQYRLAILPDGRVLFVGERNVSATGKRERMIGPEQLTRLQSAAATFVLAPPGSVLPGKPSCEEFATDFATVRLDVLAEGRRVHVEHYLGCRDAPPVLLAFERLVDDVAGVDEWARGSAQR